MSDRCKVPVGLPRALREAGISLRGVAARAGLALQRLEEPGLWLPVQDYFALWQGIRDESKDPNVGLRLATLVRPDLTEPLFLAIMGAANVAAALNVVSAFKRQLEPEDVHVVVDEAARHVAVVYDWSYSNSTPPPVLNDAELAFIVHVCREGTGERRLTPKEVRLTRRKLENGSRHAKFFGCPIRLRARHNAVVLHIGDLTRPFVTFNPELSEILLSHLQRRTTSARESMYMRVRTVLADKLRGQRPTISSVGESFAMSARKLQRLLKDEGKSFREVLDDVRNEQARAYLAGSSFSDGEISFLLGFEDPNSFYRAFRSWNGISPSAARRAARSLT